MKKILVTFIAVVTVFCNISIAEPLKREAGAIKIRIKSPPTSFLPTRIVDIATRDVAALVHAGLVALDYETGSNEVMGALADLPRVVKTQEHTKLSFKLRDFQFNDGSDITSKDVLYSFKSVLSSKSPFTYTLHPIKGAEEFEQGITDTISGFSFKDDKNFEITLKNNHTTKDFLYGLACGVNWVIKAGELEKTDLGAFESRLISAGPYKITSFQGGRSYVFSPRPGKQALPRGNRDLKFEVVPDGRLTVNGLRTGRFDVSEIDDVSLSRATLPQNDFVLHSKKANRLVYLLWNTESPNLNSDNIRDFSKQLMNTTDMQRLAKVIFGNEFAEGAQKNRFFPISTEDSEDHQRIEELAQGSVNAIEGKSIRLLHESNAHNTALAEFIRDKLRRAGAKPQLQGKEFSEWINAVINKEYDATIMVVEANMYGPRFWSTLFDPRSTLTAFGTPIPNLERILQQKEPDWQKIEEKILSSGVVVPLIVPKKAFFVRQTIEAPVLDANGQVLFYTLKTKT